MAAGPVKPPSQPAMEIGTVKWFDAHRGFGFIGRDGASDVFVHAAEVEAPRVLAPGDRVCFEVGEGPRGLLARRVRLAS